MLLATSFVLDASVTMAGVLDDENSPLADEALSRLARNPALVPYFWHIEVRNVLLNAERRGRLTAERAAQHPATLSALPVTTDTALALNAAYGLAQAYGLTFYDAVYLELALRRNAPVATLDNALGRAAVAAGLTLLR